MSNIFISVVLCPYVMSYLLHQITFSSLPWYYPYCSTLCTLPFLWLSICSILLLLSIGTLLILIYWSLLYHGHSEVSNILWILGYYNIREYISTYLSNINELSVLIFDIIISEDLFFITFFWLSFHYLLSYGLSMEDIYMSDANVITFINTFLLSNSGLSYGYSLVNISIFILHLLISISICLITSLFTWLQIIEFSNITLYMNEFIYISTFYFLIGFHLFHVVVGIIVILLVLILYYLPCSSRSILNFILFPQLIVTPHLLFYTLQLVYWHFVDILWLIIYYKLYN